MTSVGQDFPKELARVREVKQNYLTIGPAGIFGATLIEQDIQAAERALASGDVIEIVKAYARLKEIKD